MDGSVGNDSRLKPMDARQQPILASTTNVLEAVLQKHSQSEDFCPSALLVFMSQQDTAVYTRN